MGTLLFHIFVFPGLLFLFFAGFLVEYIDRKLYARFQNRIGPPLFQPFADFVKLTAKEEVVPEDADVAIFKLMPLVAFTSCITAFLIIPMWTTSTPFSFSGDLIVVLYLLTLPTLSFFLGAWYSKSLYSMVGAVRSITQLFAYEIPLFLGVLTPALLADSWSMREITEFYAAHPWYWLFNLVAFGVSFIALMGKLEKVPFDIPEAETEIVAGSFTEYSGRLFAFIRMTLNIELIAGSALLAAVFMPWGMHLPLYATIPLFFAKILLIVILVALMRTLLARFRIDQMITFCWKYLAPVAFIQILATLVIKGALMS